MNPPSATVPVDLKLFLEEKREQVDGWLDRFLPPENEPPTVLHKAMRYSVFAGGKRIRPILAILSFEASGGGGEAIFAPACAMELVHTFSLVHDDLPCMDDDDLRRGKPTLHKLFGEGVAVLAGDALSALAFELLASSGPAVLTTFTQALGPKGMLGGQVADLKSEGKKVTLADVEEIHRMKTAALIAASLKIGALVAKAPEREVEAFFRFGQKLGLAFQIVDDVLEATGNDLALGKLTGGDRRKEKATYPSVAGIEKSKEIAFRLAGEAKTEIASLNGNYPYLPLVADYIVERI
ncbi:MAG: polyprenyl synthetase family protein [candidate division Zixibacteria bacterium]|nr:polyprenyl synthetase family protein [candidate division Zixibacteria bacterium]